MSAGRLADIAHKSFVTLCLGVTVAGLIDVGFMHKTIMTKGSEAAAQKEMEQLRTLREGNLEASTHQPFPQGTDLHTDNQRRI